ncbi:cytochrome oxidase Cu insertion factor (SCO1/SenC/PrrC family) [Lysobacter sp. OAE881]|uniref:SCO family protein n=1 Tax=Lysobacter sp. OAE881 TaxID=2663813 RepID=UPI00178A43C0
MRASILLSALLLVPSLLLAEPRSDIGGSFRLTDQDGKAVTQATYAGKPALMYFGFSSCPDVCPTDLARIERIARRVQQDSGVAVTPIFVTIDPERDTPAKMKTYVSIFGKDFVGLTGTPAQIKDIAAKYHVYYKKVPYGDKGHYTMDHSTFLFLLDRQGRYVDHFGRAVDEKVVAQRIAADLKGKPVAAK